MSETTTKSARAANQAGRAIIDAVQTAGDHTLPTVVETTEHAMSLDLPTKVVLNQRLIVGASIVGGAVLGVGILAGVNKFRAVRRERKFAEVVNEEIVPNGI